MIILILGSEGFIGSHLVTSLIYKGFTIIGCDLLEDDTKRNYQYFKVSRLIPDWEILFQEHEFDFCINASGNGNVPFSVSHPQIDFEANTSNVVRVLDALRKRNPNCKYLHISSAAVYGNPIHLPVKEIDRLAPISPYGFNKLMSEIVCKEFYELYEIPITIIRPFSVYGIGLKKQIFWDLCNKINISKDKTVSLYGTGMESRDFIYIDDLIEIIILLVTKDNFQYNIYNAAVGQETSISWVVEKIRHRLVSKEIKFSGEIRIGDPRNWCADISKIRSLGFQQKVTITTGIHLYLDWFLQQYGNNG